MTRVGFAMIGPVECAEFPENSATGPKIWDIPEETSPPRDPSSKTARVETTLVPQCSACAWLGQP